VRQWFRVFSMLDLVVDLVENKLFFLNDVYNIKYLLILYVIKRV